MNASQTSKIIRVPRAFGMLAQYLNEKREAFEQSGECVPTAKLREHAAYLINEMAPEYIRLADEMDAYQQSTAGRQQFTPGPSGPPTEGLSLDQQQILLQAFALLGGSQGVLPQPTVSPTRPAATPRKQKKTKKRRGIAVRDSKGRIVSTKAKTPPRVLSRTGVKVGYLPPGITR